MKCCNVEEGKVTLLEFWLGEGGTKLLRGDLNPGRLTVVGRIGEKIESKRQ